MFREGFYHGLLDFQDPEDLFGERVWEIAQAMLGGEAFPPIVVRFDGENYWLQDGFHRVAAARTLNHEEIEADVMPGTLEDMQAEFDRAIKEHRAGGDYRDHRQSAV